MREASTAVRLMENFERLLEAYPYDQITIAKITEGCYISRQAFYKYFADKEDMCAKMSLRFLYAGFSPELDFSWRSLILNFLREQQKHENFYRAASRTSDETLLYRCFLRFVLILYRQMADFSQGQPLSQRQEVLLQIYCRGGINYLVEWMRGGMVASAEEMRDYFEASMPPEVHALLVGPTFPPQVATVHI